MRSSLRFLIALAGLVVGRSPATADGPPPPLADRPPTPKLGSSPETVRKALGAPDHVARQIVADRSLEQWFYRHPHFLRLVFLCPRGEKPHLQSVRPFEPGVP